MANYEITKAIEKAIGICKETGRASVDLGNDIVIYAEWTKWDYKEDIIMIAISDNGKTIAVPIMETLTVTD